MQFRQRLEVRCKSRGSRCSSLFSQESGPGCIGAGLEHRQQNLCKGTLPGGALSALEILWFQFKSALSVGSSSCQGIGAVGRTCSQRSSP